MSEANLRGVEFIVWLGRWSKTDYSEKRSVTHYIVNSVLSATYTS